MRPIRTLLALLILALGSSFAEAHEARPVTIQIQEVQPGELTVQWRVPRVLPVHAIPQPVLPANCTPIGQRVFKALPGAYLTKQSYRCEGTIAGKEVGIDFPYHNPSLSTLLRVEFFTGEQFAQVLGPNERTWQVPATHSDWLQSAQEHAWTGIRHVFDHWIHLGFVIALVLLGNLAAQVRLITAFSAGQLLAGLHMLWPSLNISIAFGEAMLALSVVLLAAQAVLRRPVSRQLTILCAATGLIHGWGLIGNAGGESVGSLPWLAQVVGMDATHLGLLIVLSVVAIPLRVAKTPRPWAYATGSVAVALMLTLTVLAPVKSQEQTTTRSRLPGVARSAETDTSVPSSQRLASGDLDAPIQSFLTIEPFEVRHEVLLRPAVLARQLGLDPRRELIDTSSQQRLKNMAAQYVLDRTRLFVDGEAATMAVARVDFMEVTPQGLFPRGAPVTESVADAHLGVVVSSVTPGIPGKVLLDWARFPAAVESIPTTVSDPEVTESRALSADLTRLLWENELMEDPIPTVSEVVVKPREIAVPVLSLGLIILILVLLIVATRKKSLLAFNSTRIVVALALLAAPIANASVMLPASMQTLPSQTEAHRILSALLTNVYRAFEFRQEAAVFDRLAVSVTGDVLTQIYLEQRRALELEERGGASARVDAVNVLSVKDLEATETGGFSVTAEWTVAGAVTHFGHRHFRKNRYSASMVLVPVGEAWKIQAVEILAEERVL